jgi:hypothetical protein
LAQVTWQGVSFGAIDTGGKNVSKGVSAGTGYLYFISEFNALSVRTAELITIEEGDNKKVTLTDNTVIVERGDPLASGTLGVLGSALKPPAGLQLTPGDQTIQASWQGVSGAAEYRVYCGAETAPPEVPVKTVSGTSAAITGLAYETTYYVRVQAVNGGRGSALSPAAEISLPAPVNP